MHEVLYFRFLFASYHSAEWASESSEFGTTEGVPHGKNRSRAGRSPLVMTIKAVRLDWNQLVMATMTVPVENPPEQQLKMIQS